MIVRATYYLYGTPKQDKLFLPFEGKSSVPESTHIAGVLRSRAQYLYSHLYDAACIVDCAVADGWGVSLCGENSLLFIKKVESFDVACCSIERLPGVDFEDIDIKIDGKWKLFSDFYKQNKHLGTSK